MFVTVGDQRYQIFLLWVVVKELLLGVELLLFVFILYHLIREYQGFSQRENGILLTTIEMSFS